MSEPIEDRRELNEAKKGDGEFFVTGADAAMAFDPTEEVFDLVPPPIIAAMEGDRPTARTFWWDVNSSALSAEARSKGVSIEPLVRDGPAPAQAMQQWLDRIEIG